MLMNFTEDKGKAELRFINRLDKVAFIFNQAENLEDPKAPNIWMIEPQFRVNQAYEVGGSQVIGWEVTSGDGSASLYGGGKRIKWSVGEEIKKILQFDMVSSLIKADTKLIDTKHSGKFISNLTFDVTHITNMLSDAILALFKDSLTLVGLLIVMFYQNWKLAFFAIIMIPLATIAARSLGKRIGKVTVEAADRTGAVSYTHLTLPTNREV